MHPCPSWFYGEHENDPCSCMKPRGHDGMHLCWCDQRWVDNLHIGDLHDSGPELIQDKE